MIEKRLRTTYIAINTVSYTHLKANDYINNVYGDVTIEDDFYMTLYNGACDYVEEVTISYYKLRSGGYLPKSTADILEGTPAVANQVSSARFAVEDRGESLTLTGTAKAPYKAQMTDTQLTVTLWNTKGIACLLFTSRCV